MNEDLFTHAHGSYFGKLSTRAIAAPSANFDFFALVATAHLSFDSTGRSRSPHNKPGTSQGPSESRAWERSHRGGYTVVNAFLIELSLQISTHNSSHFYTFFSFP